MAAHLLKDFSVEVNVVEWMVFLVVGSLSQSHSHYFMIFTNPTSTSLHMLFELEKLMPTLSWSESLYSTIYINIYTHTH